MLAHTVCFESCLAGVTWQGNQVADQDAFKAYLHAEVWSRLIDKEHRERVESDLRAVATTGMAITTLEKILKSESPYQPWEVGEAMAECMLAESPGVVWPWNTERDKRTPRASLPGADLIGFIEEDGETLLAFGEVKTSEDIDTPPNVMTGRSGMIRQLESLADDFEIHGTLLRWLHARCANTALWTLYQRATRYYLSTGGRGLVLFGMLMRDTSPHELDLQNRGKSLAGRIISPTRVALTAWYLPSPIASWPALVRREAV